MQAKGKTVTVNKYIFTTFTTFILSSHSFILFSFHFYHCIYIYIYIYGCVFCILAFNFVNYVFLSLYMFCSGYSVSLCCSVYCLCVNGFCTTANGCQPNCSWQIYHNNYGSAGVSGRTALWSVWAYALHNNTLVTSWRRVLVQKLTVSQTTVKFSDYCRNPSLHSLVKEPTNCPFLYPYGIGPHPRILFT